MANHSSKAGGVSILMYHYLGEPPAPEDAPYFVPVSAFEQQMSYLATNGFHCVSLDQVVKSLLEREPLPARSFVITFDDGHDSFARLAAPILRKSNFAATMYIITGKLGAPNFLDAATINSLQADGFTFGSHSHTHQILTTLPEADVVFELVESKKRLEDVLGADVRHFCYRGGHHNDRIKELVKAASYDTAVCSRPGLNTIHSDAFALSRMGIRRGDDMRAFASKVTGKLETPTIKARLKKAWLRVRSASA
jgi:peptidoglycan/xylan/chitin deacetylase (PgdA/CDA1 family)